MIRFTDFTPIPEPAKRIIIGPVDLSTETVPNGGAPSHAGSRKHIEIRPVLCQKLRCLKAVKTAEPVRLIEPVFREAAVRPEVPEGWCPD